MSRRTSPRFQPGSLAAGVVVGAGCALAASVALSAAAPAAPGAAAAAAAPSSSAADAARDDEHAAAVASLPGAPAGRCSDELQQCRLAATRIAQTCKQAGGSGSEGSFRAELAWQQDALSQVARNQLRRSWESGKKWRGERWRRRFRSPEAQARHLLMATDQMTSVLELDDDSATHLASELTRVHGAVWDDARAAMEEDPPDFARLRELSVEMFQTQDALAVRVTGDPQAREKLRAALLEERTQILAKIATLAGEDWGENIAW
jgi:hypothetical protein